MMYSNIGLTCCETLPLTANTVGNGILSEYKANWRNFSRFGMNIWEPGKMEKYYGGGGENKFYATFGLREIFEYFNKARIFNHWKTMV